MIFSKTCILFIKIIQGEKVPRDSNLAVIFNSTHETGTDSSDWWEGGREGIGLDEEDT